MTLSKYIALNFFIKINKNMFLFLGFNSFTIRSPWIYMYRLLAKLKYIKCSYVSGWYEYLRLKTVFTSKYLEEIWFMNYSLCSQPYIGMQSQPMLWSWTFLFRLYFRRLYVGDSWDITSMYPLLTATINNRSSLSI